MPHITKPLERQQYGKWRVVQCVGLVNCNLSYECECECGKRKVHYAYDLRRGITSSCKSCARQTHGQARGRSSDREYSAEYRTWRAMIKRCRPNAKFHKNYYDRGICVCERWLNSFDAFFSDMGPRPPGRMSIDRVDVNKGYEPGNCIWADYKTQGIHRTDNILLTISGQTKTVSEWSAISGIQSSVIAYRVRQGWPHREAAFVLPKFGNSKAGLKGSTHG